MKKTILAAALACFAALCAAGEADGLPIVGRARTYLQALVAPDAAALADAYVRSTRLGPPARGLVSLRAEGPAVFAEYRLPGKVAEADVPKGLASLRHEFCQRDDLVDAYRAGVRMEIAAIFANATLHVSAGAKECGLD